MTEWSLAVDIGGTKMAAGLVDRSGTLLHRAQVPTPPSKLSETVGVSQDGEHLWSTLSALVSGVCAQLPDGDRIVVCGVGCGGPMSKGGDTVSPLNIGGWRAFPLRARLSELVGVSAFVDNDAKALALGEGWIGAAAGLDDYIAMVVSTGVGGGVVLDGRLLNGLSGNAGHIGHMVVVPDGRPCVCGSQGCLEAEASGTAIAAITGQPAQLASDDIKVRTGTLVGLAISAVVNLLDLPLAVVSGSVALGFGNTFFDAAQRELDRRCGLEFTHGARVMPGGLGDAGPLVGASAVGWHGLDAAE
ncbi:MAG TPA: ROK family protein [Acidimicrobiales bacterium]